MLPVEDLKKETLGETYEHINRLIKQKNFDTKDYVKYNENLSVLEKKVQAIVIDTFKLTEGVINCLKSGDPHLVRRMLKCDWFFEDALSPTTYDSDILPNVSLSTRCKIINQLSRNVKSESDAELLFCMINKKYGSKLAEMFLAKCSYEFVSDYFFNTEPLLNHHNSEKNLINICKRFPDIVISFLKDGIYKDGTRGCKVLKYLAKNNPRAVTPVFQDHYEDFYYFRFGKKSSKALHSGFTKLAEKTSIPMLMERLNIWVIFKRLSYEDQIICMKLLVSHCQRSSGLLNLTDWPRAAARMKHFLQLVPPSKRASMVETVFFETFDQNYIDHPELWSLDFMEVFPEDYRVRLAEILDRRAEEKIVKDALRSECRDREREPKDTFVYLLGFKHAFPLLTELMSQMTTIARREILLKEMVHNCIINKDMEGLESVVRYISIRHKNEDLRVLGNVIMYNMIPHLKYMNLSVWNWMEKMATLLMIKTNDAHSFGVIMENYIAYKVKNNLDARLQVKSVLKLSVVPNTCNFILIRKIEKPYSKALITLFYDEIFCGDGDYAPHHIKERLMLSLLMAINDYNASKKRSRINLENFPRLVQGLDKMIRRVRDWNIKHSLAMAVKRNKFLRNNYASYLLDMSMTPNTIRYLIKRHPHCIVENFNRVISFILEPHEDHEVGKIFDPACQIDFLGYLPELARVLSEKFRTTHVAAVKVRALMAYSHIVDLESFIDLSRQYVPVANRFQLDTNRLDFCQVLINMPEMIRNVQPVWKNFDFVMQYLRKDYLRWVLPSFFAVCHNSPAKSMVRLLEEQLTTYEEVAVRKVILSCILDLLPKMERIEYCERLWETEKNSPLREFVFHAISRGLTEDQTGEVFEMVKKCIREADEITIHGRIDIEKIPKQYLSDYSCYLWDFAERFRDKNVAIACMKEIVSHFNDKNISMLSRYLCQKILKAHLFKDKADVFVEKFSVDYVLYHNDDVVDNVTFVLGILKQREECKSRPVRYFIHRLKDFARSKPGSVFIVFDELLKQWPKTEGPPKMFKEYLLVEYMNAYGKAVRTADVGTEAFSAVLGAELRKVVNSIPQNECFVDVLKVSLSEFVNDFSFHDILDAILDHFLGDSFGHVEGVIAIHLIPPKVMESLVTNTIDPDARNSYVIELRKQYVNIFQKLMDKKDDVLKVYMNLRVNNVMD